MRLTLFSLSLLLGAACVSEARVEAAIDAANYCDVPEDCVIAGSACPFGCVIAVNAAEEQEIRDLLADFESSRREVCYYDCAAVEAVTCEAQRCEVAFTE